ncbi:MULTISPECIES: biotin transporter BioY [unclassified Gilliamella]|uniref:biotin transporter BioY n=1 Tax=unclassified Gilliamella TaxID=2685620 RepID=UPI00226ABB5B|nr:MULTISPECIES: biotin transporter BioY [unclassified Gilliamella]MCX8583474.1 biotin transporter BioY [Gilliamella sp. B3372]MCX8585617.1 biotin transporter BioY [Gilliamella sp. B3562]MCX8595536.1 biotin transporter BioY [Gilliamella sp. B3367]MCX8670950.1 biotin transporter BioY [Gilliamella sp. B2785]MCX8675913.1 biotin transporter BioY [Gilliamella sp. B3023]
MKLTTYYPTYINTLFNLSSWQRKLCATTGAALLLGLAANISIPTYPVPFTLQSLAVLLIGAFLGRKLGALTILQYLFLGAMGLPLFANGSGGIMALASPSSGYLYGYIFSAYLAGFAAEKGYDRHFILGLIAFACAHQLLFVFGVVYLMGYLHISLIEALKVGYLPFVGVDAAKFIIATCVMFSLWRHHARK